MNFEMMVSGAIVMGAMWVGYGLFIGARAAVTAAMKGRSGTPARRASYPLIVYLVLTGAYLMATLGLVNIGYFLVTGRDLVQL